MFKGNNHKDTAAPIPQNNNSQYTFFPVAVRDSDFHYCCCHHSIIHV